MDKVPPATRYTLPALVGAKNNVSKSEPVWNMSFVKPEHTSYSYDATKGPGPAAYNTQNTDSYRRKQPHYSFGARYQKPKDKTLKPGPGAYNPEKVKTAPKFSMGVRHSQFVLPVLTAADLHLY
ncbi:ciliary microtubule associated protein 1A-like [Watersipora subatra]|uniref:ciliary microtubule associated protein 1A-like n=1 Tax=Watersipora subatra TaxID=2589382 RepID=UPI00355C922C